jgi:hypothetical protein
MDIRRQLINKYSQNSKHAHYQVLPQALKKIIGYEEIYVKTRYEIERLTYVLEKIDVKDKEILDIGGNTGFFSFELLAKGAKKVCYYEGNKEHADFVKLAAKVLNLSGKIEVKNKYFSFGKNFADKYDIIILLNVLHHIGDDYGNKTIAIEKAKESILQQLNGLSSNAEIMVFQMGFNWQGNIKQCLFENGTKQEMIGFISDGIRDKWAISHIGIAEAVGDVVRYADINANNIPRNDKLGEFLNRPLFILKSESKKGGAIT